jgi:hypothetical protein
VNWPIYRYADVLLMYAEALNEQGQPDAAIGYVNMIRARARNGTGAENRTLPADLPTGQSQAAVRAAIFDERKFELAFEGKRWFDLVRQGFPVFQAAEATDPTGDCGERPADAHGVADPPGADRPEQAADAEPGILTRVLPQAR